MYRKYIVLLYLCLFFVFSLSPWTSPVFPKQRTNRSIREPSYDWPQGTSTPAEAGLEKHRRLDTFHWPLAAECAAGSLSLLRTTENTAGLPAHRREMTEQPGCPHRVFHWNMLPWITSSLATEPVVANKMTRCKWMALLVTMGATAWNAPSVATALACQGYWAFHYQDTDYIRLQENSIVNPDLFVQDLAWQV